LAHCAAKVMRVDLENTFGEADDTQGHDGVVDVDSPDEQADIVLSDQGG
jgi:hypothetical protein